MRKEISYVPIHGGESHRVVAVRHGSVYCADHTAAEVRRILILAEFGYEDVCPCIRHMKELIAWAEREGEDVYAKRKFFHTQTFPRPYCGFNRLCKYASRAARGRRSVSLEQEESLPEYVYRSLASLGWAVTNGDVVRGLKTNVHVRVGGFAGAVSLDVSRRVNDSKETSWGPWAFQARSVKDSSGLDVLGAHGSVRVVGSVKDAYEYAVELAKYLVLVVCLGRRERVQAEAWHQRRRSGYRKEIWALGRKLRHKYSLISANTYPEALGRMGCFDDPLTDRPPYWEEELGLRTKDERR